MVSYSSVFVRFVNRCLKAPLHWKVWCSDDTMADLQAEPPDPCHFQCLLVTLGEEEDPWNDFVIDNVELDNISLIRSIALGLNIHCHAYEKATATAQGAAPLGGGDL